MGWQYDIIPLEHSDVILLFDYRFATEIVTAINSATGEVLWESTDYSYSLGRYSSLIASAGTQVGSALATRLGGLLGGDVDHQSESSEDQRERQVRFMERIIRETPGHNLIFFKTFDGLVLLNAYTGERIARVDFAGAGLSEVRELENGDFLVVSGPSDLGDLALASDHSVARITPLGQVVWQARHSGSRTAGVLVAENVVLVDGGPTEAFDLSTGDRLWTNDTVIRRSPHHHMQIHGDYLYVASDVVGSDIRVSESRIWKQNLRTGEIVWTTDTTRGELHGIALHGEALVVWGFGNHFTDNRGGIVAVNRETGAQLWTTGSLDTGGITPTSLRGIAGPVFLGDQVAFGDQERVFLVDVESGATVRDTPWNSGVVRTILGLEEANGNLVVVGTDGVQAWDASLNSVVWETEIERSFSYDVRGSWLVTFRQHQQAQVVDLEHGGVSPVIRARRSRRVFGDADRQIWVDSAARHAVTVDNRGTIRRYSF